MEVTARRCLSYLSGGHVVAILKDILYDEEKERIAHKYRLAVIRIGDAVKHFKPKQKGLILDAFRTSGFTKDDLRERGWTFSTHLWNSASYIATGQSQTLNATAFPPLQKSDVKKSRPKIHSVVTETSFRRRRR